MKKPVLSVILASIAMLVAGTALGYLFSFIFPILTSEYENESLYRAWDDPLMYLFILQPFILLAALVWIWNRAKGLFSGSVGKIAFNLSLISLFFTIIPGMIMTISSFQVSVLAVVTWTISGFVQFWVASLIVVKMNN